MKKILAGCFALMLGVSAFSWAASPEWIYDRDTGEMIDNGDPDGLLICENNICDRYIPLC